MPTEERIQRGCLRRQRADPVVAPVRSPRTGTILDPTGLLHAVWLPPNGLELAQPRGVSPWDPELARGSCPAARATLHPFSHIPAGKASPTFRTPAGSAEGPVPAVCLHCAAGTRGQVSWCRHRTCGAAQVSRAPARGCVKNPEFANRVPTSTPRAGGGHADRPHFLLPSMPFLGLAPHGPEFSRGLASC